MNRLTSRNFLLGALGSTAALAVLVSVAWARGRTPAPDPVAADQPNVASAGMVVAKDAETGALRAPTAKEMAKLQSSPAASRAAERSKVAPVAFRLPNGVLAVTLDPSFDVYSVAGKGADGTIHTACVPGEQAEAALATVQQGTLTKKEIVLDEK